MHIRNRRRTFLLFAISVIAGSIGGKVITAEVLPDEQISDIPRLYHVTLACDTVKLEYSKPFPECAHLVTAQSEDALHGEGVLCNGHERELPMRLFRAELERGTWVKLCNENDYRLCSKQVQVTSQPCPAPIILDDDDEWFVQQGNFQTILDEKALNGSYKVAFSGLTASWKVGKLPAGTYEIFTTWRHALDNSWRAKFEVRNTAYRVFSRFSVMQQLPPKGVWYEDHEWQKGATITLREPQNIIISVKPGGGKTVVDGVMIREAR